MYYFFGVLSALCSLTFLLFNPLIGNPDYSHLSHALVIGHWSTLLFHVPIYFVSLKKKNKILWLYVLLGATGAYLYNFLWVVITQPVSIYFLLFAVMATFSIFIILKIFREIKLVNYTLEVNKSYGLYLIIVAKAFYLLWGYQIISFLLYGTPLSHIEKWLTPTSPVHILDMVFFLPMLFFIGLNILKGRRFGGYFITGAIMLIIIGMGIIADRVVLIINSDSSRLGSLIFISIILIIGIIKIIKIRLNIIGLQR